MAKLNNVQITILARLSEGWPLIYSGPFDTMDGWSYNWANFFPGSDQEEHRLEDETTVLIDSGLIAARQNVTDASIFDITDLGRAALTDGEFKEVARPLPPGFLPPRVSMSEMAERLLQIEQKILAAKKAKEQGSKPK